MKKLLLFSLTLLFVACQDVGDNKPLLTNSKKKQPIFIVNANRHLNIAEFWIDQIPNPNKVMMSSKKIEQFNNQIAHKQGMLNYFKDINKQYRSSWIKSQLTRGFDGLKSKVKYFTDNNRVDSEFYKNIKENMNLKTLNITNQTTRYALTVNYSNQRIIPTEEALLKKKNQIYFDRNQNSALDIGTFVAVLHTSKDGLWHYGISPTSSGWIRNQDLAFGERDEVEGYINSKNFVVTTASKTPLRIKGQYHDYLRMGSKLPYLLSIDKEMMVLVPTKDSKGKLVLSNATVKSSNVNVGYLPYTQANIITQAFKFLHQPYGWGGMFGEQDCSKFIQEIYATTGVRLPRNSTSQSNVGEAKIELGGLPQESRVENLNRWAKAGVTILHLKGHIVLYIGNHQGEPFIIHTVWGASSRHFGLGRTAVTSLNFNGYFGKIDRITNILKQ